MQIYNSLIRKKEEFKPINDVIGMYTCGPTVYDYVTIGNWRSYILGDLLLRTLKYFDHDVNYVMNITDVGHLTGDNEGDASIGEDRLEKASKREGKTAWDIAEFYEDDFLEGMKEMNLIQPDKLPRATDHIKEQVDIIQKLEKKGFAYKISDGIYFDVKAYEKAGFKYGELSTLDERKEGARVAKNPEKKDLRDFALWKFSPENEKRQMEWDSPWGVGFPGWHVECSAMSMKYLGEKFDLHVGGEDLRSTHHPNEIVQSEGATGQTPFTKYWMHGAFLMVDGGRMGKSRGNAYTIADIEKKGFSPMDLRYFYLTGHYRKQINFTWEALEAAKNARDNLIKNLKLAKGPDEILSPPKEKFQKTLEDDLNIPQALAIMWEVMKSSESAEDKLATVLDFDKVLGLKISEELEKNDEEKISKADKKIIEDLIEQREVARGNKNFQKADEIRDELKQKFGIELFDNENGTSWKIE